MCVSVPVLGDSAVESITLENSTIDYSTIYYNTVQNTDSKEVKRRGAFDVQHQEDPA